MASNEVPAAPPRFSNNQTVVVELAGKVPLEARAPIPVVPRGTEADLEDLILRYQAQQQDDAKAMAVEDAPALENPPERPQETILEEANRIVNGPRQAQYGHPIHNFAGCGRKWGATLDRWLRRELECGNPDALPIYEALFPSGFPNIEPEIVALMMIDVKTDRAAHSPEVRDHWVDGAGYANCGWRVIEAKQTAGSLPPA